MRVVRSPQAFVSCRGGVRADGISGLDLSGHAVGVTIGNFDAYHRGHQRLFDTLTAELAKLPAPHTKVILSFWPHPRQVLSGVPQRLIGNHPQYFTVCPLKERLRLAQVFGFDVAYFLRFRRELAELSPEKFVRKHLVETFQASLVVVGDDWSFGKSRSGNTETLRQLGVQFGFQVIVVPEVSSNEKRIASGVVKEAIRSANFQEVQNLLGRNYSLRGKVRHGEKRGRTLGFPTANLEFRGVVLPPDGIYACRAQVDSKEYLAAVYIGARPTYGPGKRVVECHLLDGTDLFLYGKTMEFSFVVRTREDRAFSSREELRAAIAQDIQNVRAVFAST